MRNGDEEHDKSHERCVVTASLRRKGLCSSDEAVGLLRASRA